VSTADLPGILVAYAAMLGVVSWLAERVAAVATRRGGPMSPWAREEAVRFRREMARVVRLVAGFLLAVVLVRFRGTAWAWTAGLLLVPLAGADLLRARRGPQAGPRPGRPAE
jgi:hypothetical protein